MPLVAAVPSALVVALPTPPAPQARTVTSPLPHRWPDGQRPGAPTPAPADPPPAAEQAQAQPQPVPAADQPVARPGVAAPADDGLSVAERNNRNPAPPPSIEDSIRTIGTPAPTVVTIANVPPPAPPIAPPPADPAPITSGHPAP